MIHEPAPCPASAGILLPGQRSAPLHACSLPEDHMDDGVLWHKCLCGAHWHGKFDPDNPDTCLTAGECTLAPPVRVRGTVRVRSQRALP